MKKISKIGCLSILGFLVICLIIGLFVDTPEETENVEPIKQSAPTIKEAPENATTQAPKQQISSPPVKIKKEKVETQEKSVALTPIKKPPVEPIEVVWNKTPQEQGLKVGDWMSIIGHQDAFISATGTGRNGVFTGWQWNPQDSFGIDLVSNASAVSLATDRINGVYGRLESPSKNATAKRANNKLMRQETIILRLTGQIHQIMPPGKNDTYPNQWYIFLESGVIIQLIE